MGINCGFLLPTPKFSEGEAPLLGGARGGFLTKAKIMLVSNIYDE
jgi:hypothetical protein